jgi:quinol monooxygenase YgiN
MPAHTGTYRVDSLPELPDPYIYLWAYEVSPELVDDFYELYGPEGAWVVLFRRAPGYLDTQLIVDRNQPGRFLTIDRWMSKEAFDSFRTKFDTDFAHLDRLGEELIESETMLGEFGLTGGTEETGQDKFTRP